MTIVYRDVKGANLTPDEVDGNFHDLDDRVTDIEENPPQARSITDITAIGSSLVIEFNDSTEDGPFPLPTIQLRGRGEWEADTDYVVNDTVAAEGVVYLVTFDHTSEAPFDPGANDGNGNDFYSPLFNIPELVLPPGGEVDFVLTKTSDSNDDNEWQDAGVHRGGVAGQVYTKISSDDRDAEWRSPTSLTPPSSAVSSTVFTPEVTDANSYIRCVHPSGCTITIPAGVFSLDDELIFRQCTGGPVQLNGAAGVFFDGIDGFAERTETRGAIMHAKLIEAGSEETWEVWGLLTPLTSDDSDFSA